MTGDAPWYLGALALCLSLILYVRLHIYAQSGAEALGQINNRLDTLMALVSIEQDTLDSIATDVSDAADLLQGVLDSDTPTPAADVTAITAAVDKLKGVHKNVPPAA